MYCAGIAQGIDSDGVCVQCTAGRCGTALHVSCAQAVSVLFQVTDTPSLLYIVCNKHSTIKHKVRLVLSLCLLNLLALNATRFLYRFA